MPIACAVTSSRWADESRRLSITTGNPELSRIAVAAPAAPLRPTRTRLVVLALLAVGTMINYLDRTVLGIALSAAHSAPVHGTERYGVFRP